MEERSESLPDPVLSGTGAPSRGDKQKREAVQQSGGAVLPSQGKLSYGVSWDEEGAFEGVLVEACHAQRVGR